MNKIFRVIWNQATQSWVAVSELTKAHKKAGKAKKIVINSLMAASVMAGGQAMAATAISGESMVFNVNSAQPNGGTAIGDGAVARGGAGGVSIGRNAGINTDTKAVQNIITIGQHSRAGWDGKANVGSSPGRADELNRGVGQAIAIGGGNEPNEGAWAEGDQSISIGSNTHARGDSSIAIGGDDVDKVRDKIITYTDKNGNQKKGTINQAMTELANVDMWSPSRWSNTTADGAAVAIGIKAVASDLSLALGSLARAEKVNTVAIGSGARAELDNSVAIGGGARANSASAGTIQKGTKIGTLEYKFSGGENTLPGDIVSFGTVGFERQLKNVAAGEVSQTSRDAINGSQLFGILNTLVSHNFLKYAGDDAQAGQADAAKKVVKQSLDNNQLNLLGGADISALVDNNIGVVYEKGNNIDTNGNDISPTIDVQKTVDGKQVTVQEPNPAYQQGALKIKLAKDLKGLNSAAFKNAAGDATTINGNGISITPNGQTNPVISLTKDGLNNGGKKITNVEGNLEATQNSTVNNSTPTTSNATKSKAAPTNVTNTNAATVGDVLNAGWNLQGNGSAVDFVKPYDTVNFANGEGTTVSVESADGKTSVIKVKVNKATLKKNTTSGDVEIDGTAPTGDAYATAGNVAEMINANRIKYFSVKSTETGNSLNDGASGTDAVAVGPNATATASNSTAMGKGATAKGSDSVALGSGAVAEVAQNEGSVAIGKSAKAGNTAVGTANAATAIGNAANASADGGTAIGNGAKAFVSNSTAIGIGSIAGSEKKADGSATTNRDVAYGYGAVALGDRAIAAHGGAIAIGTEASSRKVAAYGLYSMAIGGGAQVGKAGNEPNKGISDNSMAIGYTAKVGDSLAATAIGPLATVGDGATYGLALGRATVNNRAYGSVAIGERSAVAEGVERGVALGSRSQATVGTREGFNPATQKAGLTGVNNAVADARANTYAGLANEALTSTLAAVSIGGTFDGKNNTRQINHLAAGTADTDAVNVAQLRSVNLKISGNTNGQTASALKAGTAEADKAKADVLLDSQTLKVESSDTTYLTTDATNNTITLTPKTAKIGKTDNGATTYVGTDGKVNVPTTDGLATAQDVANAINASGWKVGDKDKSLVDTINSGDQVNFINGNATTATVAKDGTTGNVDVKYDVTTGNGLKVENNAIVAQAGNGVTVDNNGINVNAGDGLEIDGTSKKVKVKAADSTISVGSDGIKVNTSQNAVNDTTNDGKLKAPDNNTGTIATIDNVINAVNNAAWKVQGETEGTGAADTGHNSVATKVTAGDTVKLKAGDNLKIKQSGKDFTFSLNPVLSGLTSAEFKTTGTNPVTSKLDGNGITITPSETGKSAVSLTNNGLDNGNNVISNVAAGTKDSDAVNLSQLKNAGWKIGNNGKAEVDTINSGEQVNFTNGNGTTVTVEKDMKDGVATGNINVKYDVTAADNSVDVGANGIKVKTSDGIETTTTGIKAKAGNGITVDSNGINVKPADSTISVDNDGVKVNTAKNAGNDPDNTGKVKVATGETGKIATIDSVVDAVNKAAWVAKATGNGTNGTDDNVSAGTVVTFDAGKNIVIDHSTANKFTFKTSDNPIFTDVQFGNNGPKISADSGNIKVGDKDGKSVKITNVADGVNDNDVVNMSQLKAVGAQSWKIEGSAASTTEGTYNKDAATTNAEQTVGANDKVGLKAGKNIVLNQKDKDFTYALNSELSGLTSAEFTPAANTTGKPTTTITSDGITIKPAAPTGGSDQKPDVSLTENGLNNGGNAITNVAGNLPETKNGAANEATTKQTAPATTGTDAVNTNNAATVGDILNAGWNIKENTTDKDFVKAYDTVSFSNGTGTTASVEVSSNGTTSTVKYNVKAADGTITVGEDGVKVTTGMVTNTNSGAAAGPVSDAVKTALKNAQKAVDEAQAKFDADNSEANKTALDAAKQDLATAQTNYNNAGSNQIATVQNVADAINNAGFTLKASAATGTNGVRDTTSAVDSNGELIKPGSTVEMVAGKNLTVKHDTNGKITFATKDDVEFKTVKVGDSENGKAPVEFKTEAAKTATNNGTDAAKQPTTALNISSGTGNDAKPTQLTGVASTLNTKPVTTTPNDGTTQAEKPINLVDLNGTTENPVNPNAAATVGDLQNMGWVVSTKGDSYKDVVKNANEVQFVGTGLATVTGKTENNIRTITVDVNAQKVVEAAQNPVVYTDAEGNKLVKGDDGNFYKADDLKDGKPKDDTVKPVAKSDVIASLNSGDDKSNAPTTLGNVKSNLPETRNTADATDPAAVKQVTTAQTAPADLAKIVNNAATVGDVLNAGWNLQGNGSAVDFVKAYDTVNFVDGKGTKAVVSTDDNLVSRVTFNIDAGEITADKGADNNPTGKVSGPTTAENAKTLTENLAKAQKALVDLAEDATAEARKEALENVAKAEKAIEDAGLNKVATAQNVAEAINNSFWTATSAATANGEVSGTSDEQVNPGDKVTFEADKNIKITQNAGTFTFATKEDVSFNTVNVGNPETYTNAAGDEIVKTKDGKFYKKADLNAAGELNADAQEVAANDVITVNPVNMKTTAAKPASNNVDANGNANQPTTALDISSGNKPTQLIGVGSVLNTNAVATSPNGTATTGNDQPKLIDLVGTQTAPINANAAATVGDLQNMGWIVSSDKTTGSLANSYSDVVKNANEVRFVGTGLATVSGKTDGNVRTVTVDVDAQKVVEAAQTPVVYTDNNGNKLTKIGDNFYKQDDVKDAVIIDGKPYPAGTKIDSNGKPVQVDGTTAATEISAVKSGDITASMNNGSNKTGDPAMKLSNVGSNLPTSKTENGVVVNAKDEAPMSAAEAAKLLQPYELDENGAVKNDAKGNPIRNTNYAGNNAATVSDVLNAGWNLQNNGNARDFVKPFDTINFIDGQGTKAVVSTDDNGTSSIVTFNVDKGEVTVDTTGKAAGPVSDKLKEDLKAAQDAKAALDADTSASDDAKKAAVDKVATAQKAVDDATNKVATAQDVADAINKSGFTLKTSADAGEKLIGTKDAGELINPGKTVEMVAGKNLTVKQDTDGKVTYATKDDVAFNTVNVGAPETFKNADGDTVVQGNDGKFYKPTDLTDGKPNAGVTGLERNQVTAEKPQISMKREDAKPATNNGTDKANQPSSALNISDSNGAPTQLTGIASTLNTKEVDTAPNGSAGTDKTKANLIDLEGTKDAPINKNAAATVGDLQNMGWIVGADGNGYVDTVKNANKVEFKGGNGISVTGETKGGVREITVAIKEGQVTNEVTITKEDGSKVDAVVIDGKYYERDTDGKPKNDTAITIGDKDTVSNAGSGFVTGNTVATAINQSGWNVGLADKDKADKAFADDKKALTADKLEKVNPDDNVRFANGKNTTVKAATVDEVNADGKKVTNTYVKVDVELPIGQITAVDAAGNKLVKDADGNWYPAKADGTADTSKDKVDPTTVRQSAAMDPENKGDKYSSISDRTSDAGLTQAQKDAIAKAEKDAADKVAEQLKDQPATVVKAAQDAAKAEAKDKYLKDNNLDKGTGGTVITNVAWGTQPNDAVNVDQLQNSGWNLDSKAVKDSNGKVITGNTAATKVKMDETVNIDAGNNIEITRNGRDIEIATSMDPTFNTVKLGSGDNAVNLSNKDGALNVGGAKITGVAAGDISANSSDAVNGAQIYALAGNQTNVNSQNTKYDTVKYDDQGNPTFTTVVAPKGKTVVTDKVTVIENGKETTKEVAMLKTYNVHSQKEIVTNNVLEAIYNMNEQGIKFFHSNDGIERPREDADNNFDSSASGKFATAIGSRSNASGENAVAIGYGSKVSGKDSISIGTGNQVKGNNSGAFGDPSIIDGNSSYSVGNNNTVATDDTFVLGNNVTNTAANSVFLGTQSGYVAAGQTTAGNGELTQQVTGGVLNQFAGGKANEVVGVVSVGAVGVNSQGQQIQQTRRIQNVAPGLLSEQSTDAINGSQLYSVAKGLGDQINNVAGQVNKLGKRMEAGIAGAMAAANLMQPHRSGQSAAMAAIGQHKNQAALAVGYSRISDNGKYGIKLSLGADTQGQVSTGAGVSYFW